MHTRSVFSSAAGELWENGRGKNEHGSTKTWVHMCNRTAMLLQTKLVKYVIYYWKILYPTL